MKRERQFHVLVMMPGSSAGVSCSSEEGEREQRDRRRPLQALLTAEPLGGGAHLAWVDNSDDEDEFMVMRMEEGSTPTSSTSPRFRSTPASSTTPP
jgi:hypothetical protein